MASEPPDSSRPAPLSEPPAAAEYDQLKGKTGRQALYRPDRFLLRDLVDRPDLFLLEVEGRPVLPRNFSLSGLSFRDPMKASWPVGDTVRYCIRFEGESLLTGDAEVARITERSRYTEVGLESVSVLDYDTLRIADKEAQWRASLSRGPRLFTDSVPEDYRRAVLELGAFCQFYENQLGKRERNHSGDKRAIAKEAYSAMRANWIELSRQAARTAASFLDDEATLREARSVTENVVTQHLIEAPVLRRAYEKPRGYPGDYEVMQHYFDNDFVGDTAFGMVFHKITNEHPLSAGVRTRSAHVATEIASRSAGRGHQEPLRVLSLGCGIAAEVGFVHGASTSAVSWTLIDQEDEALARAYRNARTLAPSGVRGPDVSCVNVSFSQLFRGEVSPDAWGEHDIVFALGLFDYLPTRTASLLLSALYAKVSPGGTVFVANAAGPNDHFWEPELALRWSLTYRDTREMNALGAGLPASARTELELESEGAYHILTCHKP
ncbi:MAG: class I SAM-dependent methyltransferase [Polyangiales bacterium]